jgi:hypothetical protein
LAVLVYCKDKGKKRLHVKAEMLTGFPGINGFDWRVGVFITNY